MVESSVDDRNSRSTSGNTTLHPYSCLQCRKKKKKCDRVYPCLNCRNSEMDCVFIPRRPSTRKKIPLSAMERLRQLEDVVANLRTNLQAESSRGPGKEIDQLRSDVIQDEELNIKASELEADFGRLAVEDGRSRYMVGNFWASLNEEVEDLKSLLKELPDKSQEYYASDIPGIGTTNSAYFFGLSSTQNNLFNLHPIPDQIPVYWNIYKENCDLLIKVLHIPTMEPVILEAAQQLDQISKGLETLMFAIYFSVVVSLSEEECLQLLGIEKDYLLHTYKFSMEQALARAEFLETDQIIVLQAFVIFLTGLRSHCSIRLMWTLTALAVRLGQNAGIHRDGTHFKLTPFVIEMRRRLWWCICLLDSRAAEDSGYDAAIPNQGVDTKIPLNINDSDLISSMTEFPEARVGRTDMTFSIIRFEAVKIFRNLQYEDSGSIETDGKLQEAKRLPEKIKEILTCQEKLQDLCLKHFESSDPFSWYTSTISRIVMTKMWLIVYHPYLRKNDCNIFPQDTRNRLFNASISNIEYWLRLLTEPRTRKWRWLCETYVQWYSLTFLLSELCIRTQGESVERAWNAVNAAFKVGSITYLTSDQDENVLGPHQINQEPNSDAYKPLGRLLKKARSARAHALLSDGHGVRSQIDKEIRTDEVNTVLEVVAESFNPISTESSHFTLSGRENDSNVYPPLQPAEFHPEWNSNHLFDNPPYPQIDDDLMTWINWQDLPGGSGSTS